jgi:ABC-type dipeptide/oligopeptide/nickel transport system permease component
MRSGFLRYSLRRLLQLVPMMLVISVINFVLIRVAPGDPALYLVGATQAPPEVYEQLRNEFGLDRPMIEQLFIYFERLAHFDLGYSFVHQAPVLDTILSRLPATFLLMGTAFVLASVAGIGLGVFAARRAHSLADQVITMGSLAGYSIPIFWLGQILVLIFSLHLDLFPSQGMYSMREPKEGLELVLDVLHHLVLPATTYAVFHLALVFRLTRNKLLDVIVMDYVLTARAKGASAWRALLRHALPNALLPVMTVLGVHFGYMIAGSVLTENVFAWPGMGRLIFEAIESRDYPVISGIFIVVSAMIILANLITDLIYAWLDPRVVLR